MGATAAAAAECQDDVSYERGAASLSSSVLRRRTPSTATADGNAIPTRRKIPILHSDHSAATTAS
ncbi:MAG: hypothetical protein IM624_10315, partial [Phenylobacterium sp.]